MALPFILFAVLSGIVGVQIVQRRSRYGSDDPNPFFHRLGQRKYVWFVLSGAFLMVGAAIELASR